MAKMKGAKDPFEIIDENWRDAVQGMTADEVKMRVSEVALNQAELMRVKKEDQDLTEKRELAKEAGMVYSEGTKMNRAKINFCKYVLESKGAAQLIENTENYVRYIY